jgi:hypothetical protein
MDGFWVMVQMKRAKISVTLSGKEAKQVDHRSRLAPSNSKKVDPRKNMQTEKHELLVKRLAVSL